MRDVDEPGRRPGSGPSESGFYPGLVLDGRYRLERPLAQGGLGSVWVGHQIALQREVAVKVLRIAAGPAQARLQREALALAAVHHPAIVEVHDFGETADGTPYLVMELVRGESVGARLQREGALPAQAAVALLLPLLEGLAVAHRAGVVHRDIKPENVVLTTGPAGVTPKLLDFGIARLDRESAARLTAEGGFLGTPAYMAPEQVRGAVADERADVWGVGALLYELIAGQAPFGHEDVIAVIRRVLDDPPSYPRQAVGLDGKLWGVLMGALRKDVADRTASALALHEALAGWLEGRGGTAAKASRLAGGATAAPQMASAAARMAATLLAEGPPSRTGERAAAPTRASASASTQPARNAAEKEEATRTDDPQSIDALIRAKLGRS